MLLLLSDLCRCGSHTICRVAGEEALSMVGVFRQVVAQYGVSGLFQGILPRMGLSIWQTLFMVSGATFIKEKLG